MTKRMSFGKNGCGRSSLIPLILLLSYCCISIFAFGLPKEFAGKGTSPFWSAGVEMIPDVGGRLAPALKLTFANFAAPKSGDAVEASIPIRVPVEGPCCLEFRLRRAPLFRTVGYQSFRLELDGTALLDRDVAGISDSSESIRIDLPAARSAARTARLLFRMSANKIPAEIQAGYPLQVLIVDPQIRSSVCIFKLLKHLPVREEKSLPPDPPIPSLPMNGTEWTRTANILQPWGRSEMEIVKHAAEQIPRLRQKFGFNAVTLLPPAAHNAISGGAEITEAEFEEALQVFRANGFRIILYSSIMHCGHDPVWQHGTLTRTHPEWSQRGPAGEPITIYGQEWLCPSSGALEYTIAYTKRIVLRFRPDANILDNNEFFVTPSGPSCHCAGCQRGFREYLSRRFGNTVFGQSLRSILIPKSGGPLYNIWLLWRNRVWAEATEKFRMELRRAKPDIVVSANTQFLFLNNSLATDRQYEHEDAVISESTGLGLDGLVDKMLLGQALAKDRPLWNYLGTFQTSDINRLQPPDCVSMNISAAVAAMARPWVVYYGFLENRVANQPSLERMAAVLNWHNNADPQIRGLKPYAPVLSLASHNSFNFLGSPLIPRHLARLRRLGVCSRIIEERALSRQVPASCRALLIEDAPCLAEESILRIVSFVSSGGILIARSDAGSYDEIGRLRFHSSLWKRFGFVGRNGEPIRFGLGVAFPFDGTFPDAETAERLNFARFKCEPAVNASMLPYRDRKGIFCVYVCSERPLPATLRVIAPGALRGRAVLCSIEQPTPQIIPLSAE